MKKVIYIFLVLSSYACSHEDESSTQSVVDTYVWISLKNKSGENLLNPSTVGVYNPSDIKIFYLKNSVAEEFYDSKLDYPRGFVIRKLDESGSDYYLNIFIYNNERESLVTGYTYIQWNATDTDTIKTEIYNKGNSSFLRTIWYNGEEKWKSSDQGNRIFEVIK